MRAGEGRSPSDPSTRNPHRDVRIPLARFARKFTSPANPFFSNAAHFGDSFHEVRELLKARPSLKNHRGRRSDLDGFLQVFKACRHGVKEFAIDLECRLHVIRDAARQPNGKTGNGATGHRVVSHILVVPRFAVPHVEDMSGRTEECGNLLHVLARQTRPQGAELALRARGRRLAVWWIFPRAVDAPRGPWCRASGNRPHPTRTGEKEEADGSHHRRFQNVNDFRTVSPGGDWKRSASLLRVTPRRRSSRSHRSACFPARWPRAARRRDATRRIHRPPVHPARHRQSDESTGLPWQFSCCATTCSATAGRFTRSRWRPTEKVSECSAARSPAMTLSALASTTSKPWMSGSKKVDCMGRDISGKQLPK